MPGAAPFPRNELLRVAMSAPAAPAPGNRWIWNKPLDLIVGCGAWTVPFLLLTAPLQADPSLKFGMEYAFYIGAMFCNFPHYFATIHRVYGTQDDFRKYRFFTVYITLLALATVVLAHLGKAYLPESRGLMPIVMTIYLTWSPYHYAGQNFGLAMMMARRNGAAPPDRVRNILRAAFLSSYAVWFLSNHTHPSYSPLFISLNLPPQLAATAVLIGIPFSLIGGTWALVQLVRATSLRAMAPTLLLFGTHTIWLTVPTAIEILFNAPFLPTYYSSGALAFMHCAQYLWITSFFSKKEREARAGAGSWSALGWYGTIVIGGLALFLPGPWVASRGFGLDLMESFLIFSALVNLHHFIVDGAIWKLRDGRIAALLLGTPQKAAEAGRAGLTGILGTALEWCRGRSAPARTLRWSIAAGLVALALVDVTHFYAVNAPSPRLDIARRLNPSDTRLYLRQAHNAVSNGDSQLALGMVKEMLKVDPGNVTALRLMLQLQTESGNPRETLVLFPKLDAMIRPDIHTLVSVGHASAIEGDLDAALARFRAALDIEPSNLEALRFLGDVMTERGDHKAAAEYYERYFGAVKPEILADPRRAEELADTSGRLGDAFAALGDDERARAAYLTAARFGEASPVADPLARALAKLARLQVRLGEHDAARESHRTAIRAVAAAGTDSAAVAASLEFIAFLRDRGELEDARSLVTYARNRAARLAATHPARLRLEAAARELEVPAGRQAAGAPEAPGKS